MGSTRDRRISMFDASTKNLTVPDDKGIMVEVKVFFGRQGEVIGYKPPYGHKVELETVQKHAPRRRLSSD